jgi:DNA polymerase-3 subunit alpha
MAKFKPLAVSPHSHSDASLDGGSTVEARLKRAIELGRSADCLTDHGVMSGLLPHYVAAEKLQKKGHNIKSIHGIEAYIIDPHRPWKTIKGKKKGDPPKSEPRYSHITIHFKTAKAYKYFCSISPKMEERAIVKFGERKPLITLEDLEPISGEITIGSGCLIGLIQKNVLRGRLEWAKEMYEKIRSIAGPGNFFVELFPHVVDHNWEKAKVDKKTKQIIEQGYFKPISSVEKDDYLGNPLPEGSGHICGIYCTNDYHYDYEDCNGRIDIQKEPNLWVLEMAKKYKDPILISLDDHFATKEDKLVQDVRLGNGQEKWKFYNEYYMMTSEECAEVYKKQLGVSDKDIEEWIDNSYLFLEFFKNYSIETNKDRWLLPTTEMVYNIRKDSKEVLWELIEKHGRMPKESDEKYKIYKDRVEYEISVLKENGTADFLPYFFVLEDCVSFAKENGIIWNVRGSAGGSLLLYLLGVSIADPIKYNLPFERFLTLGRILSGSLPDADTDWDDREVILDYIHNKYGDKYSLISTNLLLKLKTSILDVERSKLGAVRLETTIMCKNMPAAPQGVPDKDWLFGYTSPTGEYVPGFWESEAANDLKKYAQENPEIWETVQKCIGITKTKGIHAGGVILSPKPIHEDFPILLTNKGPAVAYDMKVVEMAGGVKYDFLGVSTLKAIGFTLRSIKERLGIDLKWEEFPHDPRVYTEILHKDKLEAIFQLNTKLVRPYIKQIKPNSIEQIAAITALCRPGSLDAPCPNPKKPELTAAQYFVKCATGEEKPYYIHKDLEPILKQTYGVIIYQEQTLQIYRDLAGYTFAEAEEVRRGIGKKDQQVLGKHGKILMDTLVEKRGWTRDQARTLFETIQASSKYSFNCLDGKTLVCTNKGLIELKEIVENYNNYKVLSQTDNGFEYMPVSYGQFMGNKKVYELELTDGSLLRVTPDHRLKSEEDWREVQEILDQNLILDSFNNNSDLKIKSFKVIEECDVYDIEVPGTHNFVLYNGVIAHNCSHAISYAIIAYNGCYLKYHYNLDFWKGELISHGNDEKKITSYLRECNKLLQKVDLLKSHPTEWLIEDNKYLRPPLDFVKGCGTKGAVSIKNFIENENAFIELEKDEVE